MGWFDSITSTVSNILKTAKSKADEVARAVEERTGVDIPFLGDTYVKIDKSKEPEYVGPKVSKNATPEEVVKAAEVSAAIGVMARPDYGKTVREGDTVKKIKPVPKPVQEYYAHRHGGTTYKPTKIVQEYKTTPTGKEVLVRSETVYSPETPEKKRAVDIPAYVDQSKKVVYVPHGTNVSGTIPVQITDDKGNVIATEQYEVRELPKKVYADPTKIGLTPTVLHGTVVERYAPKVKTVEYTQNKEYWKFRSNVERKILSRDPYTGIALALEGLISWDDFLDLKSTYYAITGQHRKYIDTQVNKAWKLYQTMPRDESGRVKPLGSTESVLWSVKTGVTSPTSVLAAVGEGIGYLGAKGVAAIGTAFGLTAGKIATKVLAGTGLAVTGITVGEPLMKGDVGEAINRLGMAAYTFGFGVHGSRTAVKEVLPKPSRIASVSSQKVEPLGEKTVVRGKSLTLTDTKTKAAIEYIADLDTYQVSHGQMGGTVHTAGGSIRYSIHGRPVDVAVGDVGYSGKVYTPFGDYTISGTTPYASQSYTVAEAGKGSMGFSRTVTKGYTGSDLWVSYKNGWKNLMFSVGSGEAGTPRTYNLTLSEILGASPTTTPKGGTVSTGGTGASSGGRTAQVFKVTEATGGGKSPTIEMTKTISQIVNKGIEEVAGTVSKVIGMGGTISLVAQKPGQKSTARTKTDTEARAEAVTKTLEDLYATIKGLTTSTPEPKPIPTVIPPTPVEVTRRKYRRRGGTTITIPKEVITTVAEEDETQKQGEKQGILSLWGLLTGEGEGETQGETTVTLTLTDLVTQTQKEKIVSTAPTISITGAILRAKRDLNIDLSGGGANRRKWPLWGFGSRGKKAKVGLLADWISVNISAAKFGRATHPAPTPKILEIARRNLFQVLPTVELIGRRKTKRVTRKRIKRRKKK